MESRILRWLRDAVASCTAADNQVLCHPLDSHVRGAFARYIVAVVVKGQNPKCNRDVLLEKIDGKEMHGGQIEALLEGAAYTLAIVEVPEDHSRPHILRGPLNAPRHAGSVSGRKY